MPAYDRFRAYSSITTVSNANNGNRQYSQVDNNIRLERLSVRVTGNVAIGAVAAAAIANRGSILSIIDKTGFEDTGVDIVNADCRAMGVMTDLFRPRPRVPGARLAATAIGNTNLDETFELWLAAPNTIHPGETKYVEVNKQGLLRAFVVPKVPTVAANQFGGVATPGAGTTFTWTNLNVDVTAAFDDLVGVPPQYTCFVREIVFPVAVAGNGQKIDLRASRFTRAMVIQQDSDNGEVSDIITGGIVLRGDQRSIWGDRSIKFTDLQNMFASEQGLDPVPGYLAYDFARYGRVSGMLNPYQDTNLRLEVDCSVSASPNGKIRVLLFEYQRTAATQQDPHVKA